MPVIDSEVTKKDGNSGTMAASNLKTSGNTTLGLFGGGSSTALAGLGSNVTSSTAVTGTVTSPSTAPVERKGHLFSFSVDPSYSYP